MIHFCSIAAPLFLDQRSEVQSVSSGRACLDHESTPKKNRIHKTYGRGTNRPFLTKWYNMIDES